MVKTGTSLRNVASVRRATASSQKEKSVPGEKPCIANGEGAQSSSSLLGDILAEVRVVRENLRGRRLLPPIGHSRKAIGAIANQRKVIRNRFRFDAELGNHACLIANGVGPAVELNDARPGDALAEIFVGCAKWSTLSTLSRRGPPSMPPRPARRRPRTRSLPTRPHPRLRFASSRIGNCE